MGRKPTTTYEVTDDFDGTELPSDTEPTTVVWEEKTYELYLSDENHEKLAEFIGGYIKNVDPIAVTSKPTSSTGKNSFFEEIGIKRADLEPIWDQMQQADPKGTGNISMGKTRMSEPFKTYVRENISKFSKPE